LKECGGSTESSETGHPSKQRCTSQTAITD
jgi:hypothetical protein